MDSQAEMSPEERAKQERQRQEKEAALRERLVKRASILTAALRKFIGEWTASRQLELDAARAAAAWKGKKMGKKKKAAAPKEADSGKDGKKKKPKTPVAAAWSGLMASLDELVNKAKRVNLEDMYRGVEQLTEHEVVALRGILATANKKVLPTEGMNLNQLNLKQALWAAVAAHEYVVDKVSLRPPPLTGGLGPLRDKGLSARQLNDLGYRPTELFRGGFTAHEVVGVALHQPHQLRAAGLSVGEILAAAQPGGATPLLPPPAAASVPGAMALGAVTATSTLGAFGGPLQTYNEDEEVEGSEQGDDGPRSSFGGLQLTQATGMGAGQRPASAAPAIGGAGTGTLASPGPVQVPDSLQGFRGVQKLRAAGYSAADLVAGGMDNAWDLRRAGYSAAEVAAAGVPASQLRAAGYGLPELQPASFLGPSVSLVQSYDPRTLPPYLEGTRGPMWQKLLAPPAPPTMAQPPPSRSLAATGGTTRMQGGLLGGSTRVARSSISAGGVHGSAGGVAAGLSPAGSVALGAGVDTPHQGSGRAVAWGEGAVAARVSGAGSLSASIRSGIGGG